MSRLAVEILGSGGATRTPRPGWRTPNSVGARKYGVPWARTGPSLFVHGPDVLIDTPEEACFQVDRAGIEHIAAGLYSHWHPDHTAGQRFWETRNADFRAWPPQNINTPIYIPRNAVGDFEKFGVMEPMRYKERMGYVTIHVLDDAIELGGWKISAFPVHEAYVAAFLFEEVEVLEGERARRVLICMDELHGWTPPDFVQGVDLLVLPKGLDDIHPFTGETVIPPEHPVLQSEATYRDTLKIVEAIAPEQVIFMHLEEIEPLTPPEYEELAAMLERERGWNVTFAWDGLVVELP